MYVRNDFTCLCCKLILVLMKIIEEIKIILFNVCFIYDMILARLSA
jgi:hypothetical protein